MHQINKINPNQSSASVNLNGSSLCLKGSTHGRACSLRLDHQCRCMSGTAPAPAGAFNLPGRQVGRASHQLGGRLPAMPLRSVRRAYCPSAAWVLIRQFALT